MMPIHFNRNNLLLKSALFYLLLPFVIFCFTFLKPWIGIPSGLLLIFLFMKMWSNIQDPLVAAQPLKTDVFLAGLVLVLWVVLSGIGGLAFQNSDFHIRNAIFRDLIDYKWPVDYANAFPLANGERYFLSYYIGFWLPSALFGKVFGWQAGNIFLMLWTSFGVFLTVALLRERIETKFLSAALLLIFFSGVDIVGAVGTKYIVLWPPISHLEIWAPRLQFSSFTTDLFWVFNQAIPAWICTLLILKTCLRKYSLWIWTLCLFFAPFPALGLLPFVFLGIPQKSFSAEDLHFKKSPGRIHHLIQNIGADIRDVINLENMIGLVLVGSITYFYFSSNSNASKISFYDLTLPTGILLLLFWLLEGLPLWFLLRGGKKNNLYWYAAGAMLLLCPLIVMGTSIDFCMRASIPSLFILMIGSGEALFANARAKYRPLLIILLLLGALTPLYEINRSIYRTVKYYTQPSAPIETGSDSHGDPFEFVFAENAHPSTLTADRIHSLTFFKDPNDLLNFVGKADNSLFFKYLGNFSSQDQR